MVEKRTGLTFYDLLKKRKPSLFIIHTPDPQQSTYNSDNETKPPKNLGW